MSYLSPLFNPPQLKKACESAGAVVERLQPTILVGTGVSGCLTCAALSAHTGVPFAIIRKPEDSNGHSNCTVEMSTAQHSILSFKRWLMVDDFVASGETFRKVFNRVTEHVEKKMFGFEYECLGVLSMVEADVCPQSVLGAPNIDGTKDEYVVYRSHLPIWSGRVEQENETIERVKSAIDKKPVPSVKWTAQIMSIDPADFCCPEMSSAPPEDRLLSAARVELTGSDPSRACSSSMSLNATTEETSPSSASVPQHATPSP